MEIVHDLDALTQVVLDIHLGRRSPISTQTGETSIASTVVYVYMRQHNSSLKDKLIKLVNQQMDDEPVSALIDTYGGFAYIHTKTLPYNCSNTASTATDKTITHRIVCNGIIHYKASILDAVSVIYDPYYQFRIDNIGQIQDVLKERTLGCIQFNVHLGIYSFSQVTNVSITDLKKLEQLELDEIDWLDQYSNCHYCKLPTYGDVYVSREDTVACYICTTSREIHPVRICRHNPKSILDAIHELWSDQPLYELFQELINYDPMSSDHGVYYGNYLLAPTFDKLDMRCIEDNVLLVLTK